MHICFPDLSSGEGAAPYKTVADYDHGLSRIDGFVAFLDAAAVRMREGAARGVTQPRLVVEKMIGQPDTLNGPGEDKSTIHDTSRTTPAAQNASYKARTRPADGDANYGKT